MVFWGSRRLDMGLVARTKPTPVDESIAFDELQVGAQGIRRLRERSPGKRRVGMRYQDVPRGVIRNRHATGSVEPFAASEVQEFHRSLPGYAVTPLVHAPELAARLGVASVHVKDESHRLSMPSFKILGASWAAFRALCQRVGAEPHSVEGIRGLRDLVSGSGITLVAATDGNHGRAVARMAGLLGLEAHILVPQDMVPARIEALAE